MTATWKAVIGVILIFILGWFGGSITTIVIVRHKTAQAFALREPEAIAFALERQTIRDLDLTPEQTKQLHALFVENLKQRQELQNQIQPQVKAVNRQTIQQIDALLSIDQQKRFRENLILFKRRFGRNPFNVGQENDAKTPAAPENISAGSYGPATNAPTTAQ